MIVSITGAASDLGCSVDGSSKGPEALFGTLGYRHDMVRSAPCARKSLDPEDRRKNEGALNRFNSELYGHLRSAKEAGTFSVMVGGDHACSISSALSSADVYGKIGVMWIDAHADFNTFLTTETGNIHGMPLACIAGYGCSELRQFTSGTTVNPGNICIVGARSIDREEACNLRDAGICVFTTEDIRSLGIGSVMEKAFSVCLNGTHAVHVSFDLDCIDPITAPGVSVPVPDGLTEDEAFSANRIVADRIAEVCSYDLVELNPVRDTGNKTLDIASCLLTMIISAAETKNV